MANKDKLMNQLVFKFPFKAKYYEQDFYVSSNNFAAYKLIESWPNWPDKWLNIYGPKGSGKTHLSNILIKKIKFTIVDANEINENIFSKLEKRPERYNSKLDSYNLHLLFFHTLSVINGKIS